MSGFSKRLKQYERHILLGLVILLLVSFSVVGAVQCQSPQNRAQRDYSGTFQVAPTESETISANDFTQTWGRYQSYLGSVGSPSLRYGALLNQLAGRGMRPEAAVWAHLLTSQAGEAAGYRCGPGYQTASAIQRAISRRMENLAYSQALYDTFLREYYRRPAAEFEKTLREVVTKDMFLAPLIETQRYSISYEEAYEEWRKRTENVDLQFVALRGRDFALPARRIENTRTAIQEQQDRLRALDRTVRNIERLVERIDRWKEEHDGRLPETLADLPGGETSRQDAWDRPIRYEVDGENVSLSSDGPDGEADTADDVTRATVVETRSLDALRRVGDGLEMWFEKKGAWPEDLAALLRAPTPDSLAPLAAPVRDGNDQELSYAAPEGEGAPTLGTQGDPSLNATFDGDRVVVTAGPDTSAALDPSLEDAWGRALRVRLEDATTRLWDVRSAGPDGAFDTEDDVTTGNGTDLRSFYDRPDVRSDFLVPLTRRFRAIYVHLPLVPDDVMARLWEDFPQYRPDEAEAFDRWRRLIDPYYGAEDPADETSGHGADLANRLAPEKPHALVPSREIFGEAPADLVAEDDPDREAYLEKGWREILLREEFFELLLNDQLRIARESREAHDAWEEAKAAFERGEGEDPGEEPAVVTFEGLLAGALAPYLPGEADAPYLGFFETAEPLTRAEWEADPHVGDVNLSVAGFAGLVEADQFAAIPTQLHNAQTKAILQNIELRTERQPDLEEVRDEVFERYLGKRALDLAADALERLRKDARTRVRGEENGWEKALEAWAETVDGYTVDTTDWFIGPRPPRSREVPEGMAPDEALAIERRDFVRQTGYEAVRPTGEDAEAGTAQGALAREILKDGGAGGTDSAYLVRVLDRSDPPPASFSPRDYRGYVVFELLGDLLARGRARIGPEGPRGRIPAALYRYYLDIQALQDLFDLETSITLADEAR